MEMEEEETRSPIQRASWYLLGPDGHTHEAMRDGPPVPRVQLLSGVLAGPTEDKQ